MYVYIYIERDISIYILFVTKYIYKFYIHIYKKAWGILHIFIYTQLRKIYTCMSMLCIYIYTCVYIFMYIYHVYVYIAYLQHICIHIHVCLCVCMCVCVYVSKSSA